jgi:TRAP-type C4-dicarboxylate transport system substrate-binding protein
MRRLRRLLLGLALLTAAAVLLAPGGAGAVTWDLASPYPAGDFRMRNIEAFAQRVMRASEAKLRLVVFADGRLVGHDQIDEALRGNRVPIAIYDLARVAGGAPAFGVSRLPFVAADYTQSLRLWNAARPVLQGPAASAGLLMLYALPSPPAALFSKRAIAAAADLKGFSIVAGDPWLAKLASALGATPSDASGDLARRFATRSGSEAARLALLAPYEEAVRMEVWKLVDNAYDIQASFPLAVVAVNQQAFYALDEGSQRALLNAAVEAQNAAWGASVDQRNAAIARIGEGGLIVQAPSSALTTGLVAAARPLRQEWLNAAGGEGAAILAAYGDTPR